MKELATILGERLSRSEDDVRVALETMASIITAEVGEGRSVNLTGLGTFEPKLRMERVNTHPSTGQRILVPPKATMAFRPATVLKQKVRKA